MRADNPCRRNRWLPGLKVSCWVPSPWGMAGFWLCLLSQMNWRERFQTLHIAEWVQRTWKPQICALNKKNKSVCYLCNATKYVHVSSCSQGARLESWLIWGSLTRQLPVAQSWAFLVGRLLWFNRSMKWACRKTSLCISTYIYPEHQLQQCAVSCNFKKPLLASEYVMMVSTY